MCWFILGFVGGQLLRHSGSSVVEMPWDGGSPWIGLTIQTISVSSLIIGNICLSKLPGSGKAA